MEDFLPEVSARQFRDKGLEQLGNLVLEEDKARLGVLTAVLAGVNIVLVGEPGGGKTTLGVDSYRLIDGINPSDVAEIPSLADLTPKQVAGGRAESITTTTDIKTGDKTEVNNSADITGIIVPTTKWIFANEMNRTAPHAVNAMLEAIENKTVTTSAGTQRLGEMQVAVATMNPGEAAQGTFRMTRALASRFAIGVVMGDETKMTTHESDTLVDTLFNGWESNPDAVRPVVTLDRLKELRAQAARIEPAESLVREHVIPAVRAVSNGLRNKGLGEGLPRITKQLSRLSRALAVMRSEQEVTPKEIADAIEFMVTGRLGVMDPKVLESAPEMADSIRQQAHLK